MSTINDKLDTLKSRVSAITDMKTVVKRRRTFQASELPACAVYRGPSTSDDVVEGQATYVAVPLFVDYHKASENADPAAQAETMIDEIIAAVEVDAYGTCTDPLQFFTDDVTLPDDAGGVIVVQVAFEMEFVRSYGG